MADETTPQHIPGFLRSLADTATAALASRSAFGPARLAVAAAAEAMPEVDACVFVRGRDPGSLSRVATTVQDGAPEPMPLERECCEALDAALAGARTLAVDAGGVGELPPEWREAGRSWALVLPFVTAGETCGGGMVVRGRVGEPPAGETLTFLEGLAAIAALGICGRGQPPMNGAEGDTAIALDAVIKAQEEERAHIARELHDEANQSLTSVLIGLGVLSDLFRDREAPTDLKVLWQIASLRNQVEEALNGLHRVAQGLRPPALDDLGLGAALEELGGSFSQQHGIKATIWHLDRDCPCRSTAIDTALYRIVQEALANVARHADATAASVVLACRDGLVTVQIEDNGRGWTPPNSDQGTSKHLGIIGMRERAALLGGTVRIESSPGKGTTLYCEIPADYAPPEPVEDDDA